MYVSLVDCIFFFQAEDGIRDLVRSRGLGDVYKRQDLGPVGCWGTTAPDTPRWTSRTRHRPDIPPRTHPCLLYTSDAADERSSVDLGGRRIIKKKKHTRTTAAHKRNKNNECSRELPRHHLIHTRKKQ